MKLVKNILRNTLAGILLAIRNFADQFFKFEEILVLTYHSISKNSWDYSIDPEIFEKQIKFLAENYSVVPLERIVDYAKNKINLPSKTVAITFDDGFKDFYSTAFPILKKYNMPVTVFITSALDNDPKRLGIYAEIMNWEDVVELSKQGVVFGSHGVHHLDFRFLTSDDEKAEIINSKMEIEKKIGRPVRYFAFPYGRMKKGQNEILKSSGYEAGFSIKQKLICVGDDIYFIKRSIVDRGQTFIIFKARLTKSLDWWTALWKKYKYFFI